MKTNRATTGEAPQPALSPRLKIVLSAAIALHILAVFVGPWAMPPHGSELARTIARAIEPYLQGACLNNGYRFFAPEPGPGHLVRYEVVTGDGRQIDGFFPDKATEWPRLLYHRYFMLSEFLNSISNPGTADLASKYADSYAYHLTYKYDARNVKLYLRQHRLPSIEDVRGGMKLDDPSLYDERLITSGTP